MSPLAIIGIALVFIVVLVIVFGLSKLIATLGGP